MDPDPATPAPVRRQFFARPFVHALFLAPMGSLILLGVILGAMDSSSPAGWIVAGMMTLLTACFYFPLIWSIRLRLSPEGIRASAPFCTLQTRWANVDRLALRDGRAGLVLREPISGKGVDRLRKSLLTFNPYDAEETTLLHEGRYLPLRGFEHVVKTGIIQQALAAAAPDATPAMTVPSTEKARIPARAWVIIGGAIAAGVGVTLLPPPVESRVNAIVALVTALAATIAAGCQSVLLWRRGARLMGGMIFTLSVILLLLTVAAAERVSTAFST